MIAFAKIDMLNRRTFLSAAAAAAMIPSAWAQAAWPSQSVQVIVPYATGGLADTVARKLSDKLTTALGQRFTVLNQPGAGGTTGMAKLAKADPTGYTLALSAISPLTLSPHLSKQPYNADTGFEPITPVMYSPVYVIATGTFGGKSWDDLIAQAKSQPGTVRFATSGIGSVGHIMLEQIQAQTGAKFVHMPYKGAGQLISEASQDYFEIMVGNPFEGLNQMISQGKLRVLAVTGPQRITQFSNVPTLAEKGLADANLTSTFGLFAPAGVPAEVVNTLHTAVQKHLNDPEISQLLKAANNMPLKQTPQEFAATLRKESQSNASIIKQAGIKM